MIDQTQAQSNSADISIRKGLEGRLLEENEWDMLLHRIKTGHCTPFIGGMTCSNLNQLVGDTVQKCARSYPDYPFGSIDDLPRAAQFVALKNDKTYLKERINEELKKVRPQNINEQNKVYDVLARLPFPVFITTNYHDLLEKAILSLPNPKDVRSEFCRWDPDLPKEKSVFDMGSNYTPDVPNPVVFHLFGDMNHDASLVLTEDDYFDFLVSVSEEGPRIPPRIQEALSNTSLMFLGYRVFDWDFRILFRIVAKYLKHQTGKRFHVAVQIEPDEKMATGEQMQLIQDYFKLYFGQFYIQVYWVNCKDFAASLSERWEKFQHV